MNKKSFILLPALLLALGACVGPEESVSPSPSVSPSVSDSVSESPSESVSPSVSDSPSSIDLTPVLVTVISDEVNQVTTFDIGQTIQLLAVVAPQGADQSVGWISSDPTLVTIDQNGLATAVQVGTVTITATSTAKNTVAGTIELTVKGVTTIAGIKEIEATKTATWTKGTVKLDARVVAATTKGIVLYDGTGLIYDFINAAPAFGVGSVINVAGIPSIYPTNNDFPQWQFTSTAVLTASTATVPEYAFGTPAPWGQDELTAWNGLIGPYITTTVSAYKSGNYYNCNALVDGAARKFSIVNPTVELAGPIETATEAAPVKVDITGFMVYVSGSTGTYANIVLTQVATLHVGPKPTSVGVTAEGAATSLKVGATLQLTAAALPAEAEQTVTWTSGDETKATVSATGLVTGVAEVAEVVITATSTADTAILGTITLKVEAAAPVNTDLLAKYDLSDQVRTAYGDGQNTKYAAGAFAPFLKTKIAVGGTEKLASSTGETNVYTAAQSASATGPQFNGIKFGSSSAGGTVTLVFDAGTNISKVVVGCAGWASTNTDTVTIGGITKTPVQGGATATVEELEFTFAATDSVTITTTKRIIFSFITVYHVQDA